MKVTLLALVWLSLPLTLAADTAVHWNMQYQRPEDLHAVVLTIKYRYWDPNVDGDLASKKVLLEAKMELPSQNKIPFVISLSPDRTVLIVDGKKMIGHGFRLDSTFARAAVPKLDADGFYVLAQKPVDPKNPAPLGHVDESSAWIELGISPQP
ncbi:MAG: hypothetical protein LV479_03475 [Methylacidiphilales bacterium]|nr:hypothetical protein [Candidatus Methylacidiphilales bacterium]